MLVVTVAKLGARFVCSKHSHWYQHTEALAHLLPAEGHNTDIKAVWRKRGDIQGIVNDFV